MTVVKSIRSDITNRVEWRIVMEESGEYIIQERVGPNWAATDDRRFNAIKDAAHEVEKRSFVRAAEACDGLEVHRDDWGTIRELLAEKRIASIGPARGPEMAWKRIESICDDEE